MPDAIITATASTFGTITGTFAADQSTVTGTVTGIITGTLSGSVGVPGPKGDTGPQGPQGEPGEGVPAGGTAGQFLQKIDGVDYNTDWVTLNLSAYAPLNSPLFTGDPRGPTAPLADNDTSLATTAFVQQELASGTAVAKNLEVYVRNQTGSTLAAGTIVYINGATGNRPTVTPAQANNDANSAQTMGFVKTAIANNGFGYVIVRGELENIDTQALTEGVQLYLSPTTPGAWTTTKPSAPQHLVYVGIVIRSHPTQGVILVAVQNGYELDELHDVQITSKANNDLLTYESSSNLWKNKSFGTLGLATQSWVNSQGFLTSSALTGYATESWVNSNFYPLGNPSGYLTDAPSDGNQYARKDGTWDIVSAPAGYITSVSSPLNVSSGDLSIDLTGYATESWVQSQGYLTSVPPPSLVGLTSDISWDTNSNTGRLLIDGVVESGTGGFYSARLNFGSSVPNQPEDGDLWRDGTKFKYNASMAGLQTFATESFVTGQGYITSSALTGYATQSWVTSQGYLTTAPVTSVAGKTGAVTLTNTDISGLGTLATVNDAPSDGNEYVRKNAAWAVATGGGGSGGVDVQTFGGPTTSGTFTWTKPAGAKMVEFILVGGGGGGGSGARYSTTNNRGGGGGGCFAKLLQGRIAASFLGSTETVTVGAGGAGGASRTTDTNNGFVGANGGDTIFSNFVSRGGSQGQFGSTSSGGSINSGNFNIFGVSSALPGATANSIGNGNNGTTVQGNYLIGRNGGGGAGQAANVTTNTNGGSGGAVTVDTAASGVRIAIAGGSGGNRTTSTNPTDGTSSSADYYFFGTGGGGGGYKSADVGQAGANGGWPGGGGGGGSASDNGFNSGAGGTGGNGIAIIITYF